MKIDHYTAASNGCLLHFPNNSLSKFSNVVPPAALLMSGKNRLFVRLRSIAVSHSLTQPDIFAGYAKVHLSELDPSSLNSTYEKSLGRFPFPPEKQFHDYAIHEFENTPYLPIRTVPLTQISILITNSLDQELQLADGPPTLVQLEISDMDVSGQFTVTCMSHSPKELEVYPDNTLDHFRVRLPQEMNLRNWEVGLVSVGYPPDMDQPTIVWWSVASSLTNLERTVFTFDLRDFDTTLNFVKLVNNMLKSNAVYGKKVLIQRVVDVGEEEDGFFKWVGGDLDDDEVVTVAFSLGFCRAFGQITQIAPTNLASETSVTMHGHANIHFAVPTSIGMLYCDIVEASAVSDGLAPLLQIMPVNHKGGNHLYEPQHMIFHQVVSRSFSDITFRLKRPDGQEHNLMHNMETEFSLASGGLSITLLFRPKSGGTFECGKLGIDDC